MNTATDATAITPGLNIKINYLIEGHQDFGTLLGYVGNRASYIASGTVIDIRSLGGTQMQLVLKEHETGVLRAIKVDSDDPVWIL